MEVFLFRLSFIPMLLDLLYLTHPRRATARSLRGLHIFFEREIVKRVLTSIKFSFFRSSFSFLFHCRCLIFHEFATFWATYSIWTERQSLNHTFWKITIW